MNFTTEINELDHVIAHEKVNPGSLANKRRRCTLKYFNHQLKTDFIPRKQAYGFTDKNLW